MLTTTFGFGGTSYYVYFYFGPILDLFCPFWALRAIFGFGDRIKTLLELTYVDYLFWF